MWDQLFRNWWKLFFSNKYFSNKQYEKILVKKNTGKKISEQNIYAVKMDLLSVVLCICKEATS